VHFSSFFSKRGQIRSTVVSRSAVLRFLPAANSIHTALVLLPDGSVSQS
jgi:hypothetical protein